MEREYEENSITGRKVWANVLKKIATYRVAPRPWREFSAWSIINQGLCAVQLNGLKDASSSFSISEGIFEDFRDYQFLNQHLILANINDSREAIERFVWSSAFDP